MAVPGADVERRLRRFEEACRRAGLKRTHQRLEVFREAARSDEHPDAETLYRRVHRRVQAISRDTVYRTLASLEKLGLVRKAEIIFERGRYDANMDSHHHFVCTRCGRVRDFCDEGLSRLAMSKSVRSMGDIQSAHVQVRGVCAACGRRGRRRLSAGGGTMSRRNSSVKGEKT